MEKYKDKYRIPTNRLQGYDYGSNGCYYVTICTKNRYHYFGNIVNHEMQLSEAGAIAENIWLDIPNHWQEHFYDRIIHDSQSRNTTVRLRHSSSFLFRRLLDTHGIKKPAGSISPRQVYSTSNYSSLSSAANASISLFWISPGTCTYSANFIEYMARPPVMELNAVE